MEAPKKIYICPSELAGIDYEEEWLDRPFGDSIEYIRTDVVIEKVCEYFASHINDNNGGYDRALVLENFKKYLGK